MPKPTFTVFFFVFFRRCFLRSFRSPPCFLKKVYHWHADALRHIHRCMVRCSFWIDFMQYYGHVTGVYWPSKKQNIYIYIYSTYINNIRYYTHIHVYTLPKTITASEHGPSPNWLTPTISKHPIQGNLLTVVNSESLDGHGINALLHLLSTAELRWFTTVFFPLLEVKMSTPCHPQFFWKSVSSAMMGTFQIMANGNSRGVFFVFLNYADTKKLVGQRKQMTKKLKLNL